MRVSNVYEAFDRRAYATRVMGTKHTAALQTIIGSDQRIEASRRRFERVILQCNASQDNNNSECDSIKWTRELLIACATL